MSKIKFDIIQTDDNCFLIKKTETFFYFFSSSSYIPDPDYVFTGSALRFSSIEQARKHIKKLFNQCNKTKKYPKKVETFDFDKSKDKFLVNID